MSEFSIREPYVELRFEPPPVPDECVEWCRAQTFEFAVFDDAAQIDLDWWNERLELERMRIQLRGRGLDGDMVDSGMAEVTRLDLYRQMKLAPPPRPGPICWTEHHAATEEAAASDVDPAHLLATLFLVAAWLSAHTERRHPRRFPQLAEVDESKKVRLNPLYYRAWRSTADPRAAFAHIFTRTRRAPLEHHVRGLGTTLGSHWLAARSLAVEGPRLVPVEAAAISMLVRLGWREFPPQRSLTAVRYMRFQETVRRWAVEGNIPPELVERWLTRRWAQVCPDGLSTPMVS